MCLKNKIRFLDIETTGTNSYEDEILSLSILDYDGILLFKELIRPRYKTEWKAAARFHGITANKVANRPTIDFYKQRLDDILNENLVVAFNNGNNIQDFFLQERMGKMNRWDDAAHNFALAHNEWDGESSRCRMYGLHDAAPMVGFSISKYERDTEVKAHACRAVWLWCKSQGVQS